ncbi:MAG: cobalamin-binding protein [Planctomycetes bacterium]|nr:cobalamin-binding protein [Planctomycetota bacterium]
MPRIVTMIASATEIVCALGCERDLVARSHECDWPPSVKTLPICTAPRFDIHGSSGQIDERVKSLLAQEVSIYQVDAEMLCELDPDVIITQAQCDVCAVSERDVQRALPLIDKNTNRKIVSLSPYNLADVWQSIRNVADALGVSSRGETVVEQLQDRVRMIAERSAALAHRPTVACLEWLDPLMTAGNWVPELVELAGGCNLFGSAGEHSPWMTWAELRERDPDILIALPCGFDLATTRREMACLSAQPGWTELRAVRDGRVFVTDGNQFFNRPGPRLVESLEILAEMFHPEVFSFRHEGTAWQRFV